MIDFTAEQKIRRAILHSNLQHEGPDVIRWITGGPEPSIHVRFEHEGIQTILYCPQCGEKLGQFDSNYGENTSQRLAEIRKSGNMHQQRHKEIQ